MKRKGLWLTWVGVILLLVIPSTYAHAVTQGDVAVELVSLMGLGYLGPEAAVSQLTSLGIKPDGGWNGSKEANNSFLSSLFISVQVSLSSLKQRGINLSSAEYAVAAAATAAGYNSNQAAEAIGSIAGANKQWAKEGASAGMQLANKGVGGYGPGGRFGQGYGPDGRLDSGYGFGPGGRFGGGGGVVSGSK